MVALINYFYTGKQAPTDRMTIQSDAVRENKIKPYYVNLITEATCLRYKINFEHGIVYMMNSIKELN